MLTNPSTMLYNQINLSLKNTGNKKKPAKTSGLLGKTMNTASDTELDMNKPVNRVTEYVRNIRSMREELDNGDNS